jgi:N-acetylmuramoyl-L-alanine amidase
LGGAGFAPVGADRGTFDGATLEAVRGFQRSRGLHDHGTCDEVTWLALVEASWRLGDRPLKLLAPNLRGDDVGTLQTMLGRLGFDCGRVDGIFGPLTARALEDFQRNCGLDVDGVCGPGTAKALSVISSRTGSGPGMATMRELERLGTVAASVQDQRIVLGQYGGLGALVRSVARDLRANGARVVAMDELDPSRQAAAANRYGASVYVGFEPRAQPAATISYYSTAGFTSAGGQSLACRLATELAARRALDGVTTAGMRLTVLRETRMTAIVCSLGPVKRVTDASGSIGESVVAALAAWVASPLELTAATR